MVFSGQASGWRLGMSCGYHVWSHGPHGPTLKTSVDQYLVHVDHVATTTGWCVVGVDMSGGVGCVTDTWGTHGLRGQTRLRQSVEIYCHFDQLL
jgi:hypothetical protein